MAAIPVGVKTPAATPSTKTSAAIRVILMATGMVPRCVTWGLMKKACDRGEFTSYG